MRSFVKKCRNNLCGKLIYSDQYLSRNDYCDAECRREEIRWNSLNVIKRKLIIPQSNIFYPHKWLPVVLEIPA